mgnify:CR=1 FL=1
MSRTGEIVRNYAEIREDYTYNPSIMNEEEERVREVKRIINTKLSVVDKTIILLYVDCQSYRKLGKRLGLSHMTCRKEVKRIIKLIKDEMKDGNNR